MRDSVKIAGMMPLLIHDFEAYHNSWSYSSQPEIHSHEFYELYFFIEGDARIVIENYSAKLERGDMMIFPPGYMHHAFFEDFSAPYERAFVYVTPECLRSMSTQQFNMLEIIEACVAREKFLFKLPEAEMKGYIARVDDIIKESNSDKASDKMIGRCRLNMLLVSLCVMLSDSTEKKIDDASELVSKLMKYINEHITENITLDELAENFFVNKYYLMHAFKAHTNTSIYQYVLQKRITYAKRQFQLGESPSETARKCGFTDYSGFYKSFRKATGVSPQQYVDKLNADLDVAAKSL